MDEENQKQVQKALNKLLEGRTTLVIAHRLSTLRNADKIITFDQGKIAESGTHEQLLEKETSLYAKLWNAQFETETVAQDSNPQDDETVTA